LHWPTERHFYFVIRNRSLRVDLDQAADGECRRVRELALQGVVS
jgi:hypothetical protein